MAKIVSINSFEGDLYIAQKSDPAVSAAITKYIEKYEFEYFKNVLGYDLANDFWASLPVPVGGTTFDKLLNGYEFTGAKGKEKWIGFKNIVANYIYFQYTRGEAFTQSTGAGEKVAEAMNTISADPVMKMKKSWDDMVKEHWILLRYINANRDTYPKFNPYYSNGSMFKFFNPWF